MTIRQLAVNGREAACFDQEQDKKRLFIRH